MKYKITYWVDGDHKIVDTKIEETELTVAQLLSHSHVISVVPVEKEEEKTKTKEVKK